MYKIQGKYNEAIVYTSNVEETALQQLQALCDMEIYKDSRIRIMPDVHAGAGCTIGTTMTLHGAVTPNMVGVDIGCGMETVMIKEKEIDLEKLDRLIHEQIPSGINVRKKKHVNADQVRVFNLRCISRLEHLEKELKAIGSLGGGNHFIEVDKDEKGTLYIVIHSGSRHLGKEVAEIYQRLAWQQINGVTKEEIQKRIDELKSQGRSGEISAMLEDIKKEAKTDIPKEMAYVSGSLFKDYIHDMKIMQEFADINRKTMMQIIVEGMGLTVTDQFTTVHNYIDTENMILRKGSVSAQKGEKLLIPINMRDGSLICIGKGNPEWNCSAPHGAGRIMSRNEAFRSLSVEEFERQMEGIYSTTVNRNTLDESPMAYKDMKDIVENITPTAQIIQTVKPIYNFKADE
ncbi:MAG: RtcB family protein [Erysipelotrichaceae bacterium]|nr:RtcB family protein [Erysipelotrichaceae bacterium]